MITQVFFGKEVRIGKVTIPAYHQKDMRDITVEKTGDTFAFFHRDFPGVAYCTSVTNVKSWTVVNEGKSKEPQPEAQDAAPPTPFQEPSLFKKESAYKQIQIEQDLLNEAAKDEAAFVAKTKEAVSQVQKKTPGRKKKVTNG